MLDRAPELAYTPPPTLVATAAAPVAPPSAPGAAGVAPPLSSLVGGAGWAVPRELPAGLVTFVGRGRETAEVVTALRGATPAAAVVVTGAFGSGKTALAVRAAHAVAADFPDGQVFVDLGYRPSVTPDEVLARVLRALGVPAADVPAGADERAGWFRTRVADRRLLLVVDGVTGAQQVRPLIPAGPGPALVVVAQRQLRSLDGVRRVALAPVDAAGARALLAAFGGAERLDVEPAATAELVRLCGGSALALRITASRLASRPDLPVAVLVEQLRDRHDRLDLLAYEDLSVRASLAAGVAAVRSGDEVAGRLLELLGESPDAPALPERTAALLGVSAQRARHALERLVDSHLIHRDERGGYRLPALVRDYVVELAAVPQHPSTGWRVDPVAA